MSKLDIDSNIAQTGLDSGSLTMLGAVVQQFEEPGEYRGTVRRGETIEKVFYLSVDKDSPVAAADIDLARLAGSVPQSETGSDCCPGDGEARFSVNPRGFVLFRVSGGRGGYSVNLRRAQPDEDTPVFDSSVLDAGATFSARVLRPGVYSVTNARGEARATLRVAYPPRAFSGYRPPEALRVTVTERGFEPENLELVPTQGLIFDCSGPARIVIALEEPDDGPADRKR
jgi:hypothetical protein